MSKFTKQAIMQSFWRIAAKKPIEKITVKDVVEDCGINRNTFYYHFSDLYGLMEYLLIVETEKAIEKSREKNSLAEGCISIVDRIRENREAFRNIYNTIGRDSVEYAISKALDPAVEAHVRRRAEGKAVSDADILLITGVCRSVFFGMLAEWMKRNLRDDPRASLIRVEQIFGPGIDEAIRISATQPPFNGGESI